MTEYAYKVTTNGEADSRVDVLGHPMPAHMFVFVVVDEVGRDGFLVRNCYASVDSPWLKPLDLGRAGEYREVFPERLGLWGKGPDSTATIAEHVMGDVKVPAMHPSVATFLMGRTGSKARRSTSISRLQSDPERESSRRRRSG